MAKKIKSRLQPGLHEIKNKKRPRAVRRKKEDLHLEGKRRHRVAKLVASLCAVAVIGVGAFFINAFFFHGVFEADITRSASISRPVPTDGTTPLDYDDPLDGSVYKGLDNFAFINWQFQQRDSWSLEMHGTTIAGVMGINVDQSVNTWKQFSDDILISVDITTSSMVNAARQFCYVGDNVIWREAKCKPAEYNGLDTPWPDGDPYGHLTLDDFRRGYGLPATELSVYVFNEENVLYAEPLVKNDDGTFTQTWHLDPDDEKAPYFYRYQMQKTGNLTGLPTFYEITVTYTFDSNWIILESDISETCNAPMGVSADCASSFHTVYRYDEASCTHTAYDDYFYRYADKPATGEQEHELTATDCLSQAFGSFTNGSPILDLELDLNGTKLKGILNLSIGDEIDVKARIGNIDVWYAGDGVFLKYGDVKAKLSVPELIALVAELMPKDSNADLGIDLDLTTILNQLVAEGEFTLGEKEASLKSKLSLFGLELPVNFEFIINEDKTVSLGKVSTSISVSDSFAIGAGIAFGKEQLPALTESEKATFVELVPYAKQLIKLFTSDNLHADINYENEELGLVVSGGVDVSLKDGIKASGALALRYGKIEKQLTLGYVGGEVYLDLDGVKVRANVDEAIALISSFLSVGEGGVSEGGFDLSALLGKIFTDEFAGNLSLTELEAEEANSLQIAVLGTELLKAFGVDFDLGNVVLTVSNGTLKASAFGAEISVSAGSAFAPETSGYTDIVKYAQDIIGLVNSEYFAADVAYSGGGLTVNGTVHVGFDGIKVLGEFTLQYEGITKEITVIYEEEYLYLAVEGLRVKLNTAEAIQMVTDLLMPEGEATEATDDILEKILCLNFGEVIQLGEVENKLDITLKSAAILGALGVGFDLGDISLVAEKGKITVSALGADITLTAGKSFTTDTEGYVDISPVVAKIPALLREQGISFSGEVSLTVGDTQIILSINEGALSWANGVTVYLDATIEALGTTHDILLSYTDGIVTLVYGEIGVRIVISELSDLEKAFVGVYDRVRAIVGSALLDETTSPLPVIEGVKNLLGMLQGGASLASSLEDMTATFDWTELVDGIVIGAPTSANGIVTLSLGGLTAELLSGLEGNDLLGLTLNYTSKELAASAKVQAAVIGEMPAMPDTDYLGVRDFADLLDYLGATVALIAQEHLNLKIEGTVESADEKYDTYSHVKYAISGDIHYYSGGGFPFELDVNGKNLVVNTKLFLQVSFAMKANHPDDSGLYLDITVIDADLNGKQDDVLDFYVSVSTIGEGNTGYKPLLLYAPSDEIMTLLSGVCVMFDIDVSILNDYLISKWLTAEESAQLKGLGDSLKLMIGDLMNMFGSGSDAAESEEAQLLTAALGEETRRGIITTLARTDGEFTLALNSSILFGKEGLDDLRITLSKEYDEAGNSYLKGASVHNIYANDGVEKTSIGLSITREQKVNAAKPSVGGWFNVNGIDKLILTLAKSTTHSEEIISGEVTTHQYVLNKNFFIDGSISLRVTAIGLINVDLNINVVGMSVTIDETGTVGVNVRFEYKAVKALGITAINGNTVVDLTGKDNMVYIKRVQTTDADGKNLPKPITLYRAMPLANFGKDLIPQAAFLFNLNTDIVNLLSGIEMGGSDSGTKEKVDIGTTVGDILGSIVYTSSASGDTWKITLNGKALTDALEDIVVTIGADSAGKLRKLSASTSLSTTGVSLTVNADFNFRNPCGIMDTGVRDETNDIADTLTSGMSYKLETVDWGNTAFIEGEMTSVEYILGGKVIATQDIVIATGTADVKGTVYGALVYPDLRPYNEKGYIAKWDKIYEKGEALPESRQIFASYEALTFGLTFVFRDGSSETREYIYGDNSFEFPFERSGSERVAYYVDKAGNEYRTAADLTNLDLDGDLTLYAKYVEDVYTVTFLIEDGRMEEREVRYGETILLTAPEREGYTFAGWYTGDATVEAGTEITVWGDMLLIAQWKENADAPDSYLVTVQSEQPYDGFTGVNDVYIKTYTYSGATIALDTLADLSDYFFMGYYTGKNGAGEKVTSISGITEDTTLYIWWQNKTVTFKISSDIEFAGATFDIANNRYFKQYTLKDNYNLDDSYMPKVDGYQTLALWHWNGSTYERVTNVRGLDGEDIWVLWIKNIKVTVTEFSESLSTFTIKGYAEGGSVYGNKSNEIFTAIKGKEETVGQYSIYSGNGKNSDKLKYNKEVEVDKTTGEFGDSSMTSFNALFWSADYGGILITKKFTYTLADGTTQTITTANASYVSKATYTVTYDMKDGSKVQVSGVRADYPYDNYDSATYVDELARQKGIFAPEKEGYTVNSWPHVAVTGNMTVEATYTPNSYLVTFYSNRAVPGWVETTNGIYTYECFMKYDSTVIILVNGQATTYTVGLESVIWLPDEIDIGKRKGYWTEPRISENSAEFVVEYEPDTVIYSSAVTFTYGGMQYGGGEPDLVEYYRAHYTLITPTAAGYKFLGWFVKTEEGWRLVDSLEITDDAEPTVVEALWMSNVSVTLTKASKSFHWGGVDYDYAIGASITGGELKGAFADEVTQAQTTYRYYVNNNQNHDDAATSNDATNKVNGYVTSNSVSFRKASKNTAHAVVTVTYTYNGWTFTSDEAHAYKGV